MKSNLFLRVISVWLSILLFVPAAFAGVTPRQAQLWAEQNGRLLIDTFKERDIARRYRELDRLFLEYVDLPYIGKFVVGRYWRDMSTQQQAEYQALFRRYALALYKTFPLDFTDSLSYEVGQAYEEDGYTVVAATVHVELSPNNPQDFLLQFRLRSVDGGIKLVDIKLAESSLILSYRSKFYKMIAADDGEMSWFLEDLQAMTEAAERNNQALLPPE